MQKVWEPIQRVWFTKSTVRQASILEKRGPSLGKIQLEHLIRQVLTVWNLRTSPMKRLEDNSDVPQARLGILPTTYTSSKKKTKLHSTFPEERGFVVDSGGSMHMVSKRDLNSAELETMGTSRSPTAVMKANGEVHTREEATVYVNELVLFVTVMLLEETPAVLSLGKLCEDHGKTYHWTSGQKPTPHQKW